MSFAGDDLVLLVTPRPSSGVGLKKGTVVSWNIATGENVIEIDGVQHVNLPYFNSPEAGMLAAGDNIVVVTDTPSWFVLGRVIQPGS